MHTFKLLTISFVNFIKLIGLQYHLVLSMAKQEISKQYVGSFLGVLWAFISPMVTVAVFWVVFGLGFRAQPKSDVPFVIWLVAGLAMWSLFSEVISGSGRAVTDYSYLVKRSIFPSQILPLVKMASSIISHVIFLLMLFALIFLYGLPLSLFFLQGVYYIFCTMVITLGIGWLVAALNVFTKDTAKVIEVFIRVGFWMTPIFWELDMMPPWTHIFFKLNPVYYLVQGYRESFIYFVPFWHHPLQTLYFWAVAILLFIAGAIIFQRLKPQFAAML